MWGKPNTNIKPKENKSKQKSEAVYEWEVVKGKEFDPKTIEKIEFTYGQRVKIIEWFYKWYIWKAMDRKVKYTLVGAVITYQIQLDTWDFIECYPHEIIPL